MSALTEYFEKLQRDEYKDPRSKRPALMIGAFLLLAAAIAALAWSLDGICHQTLEPLTRLVRSLPGRCPSLFHRSTDPRPCLGAHNVAPGAG